MQNQLSASFEGFVKSCHSSWVRVEGGGGRGYSSTLVKERFKLELLGFSISNLLETFEGAKSILGRIF